MKPLPPTVRRHPIVWGVLAVLLLLAAVFALCEWRGWPFLRGPLERTLSQRLDREVRVGERFQLKLLGALRVRTDTLSLGPPRWAGAQGGRFFDAQDVGLQLPWSTVWNVIVAHKPQPLRVASLEVGSFEANLWRRADGRANWQFELPKSDPERPRVEPEFERFVVRNGSLTLKDEPTDLQLRAVASTSEGLDAGPEAGLHIRGDGRYREGDFNFTMRSNGVLPLVAGRGDAMPVRVAMHAKTPNGRIKFDGEARDVVRLEALQGSFAVSGSSLAKVGAPFGITLPTTAAFDSAGRLAKQGQVWKANFERFDVGSSRLAGDFEFDRRPAKPVLTGTLRGSNLDLADLGPAIGTGAPGGGGEGPRQRGRLFPEREFNIPSLHWMNADVKVALQRADLHTARLEPFTPLHGRILLKDAVLALDDIVARTAGGEIRGELRLDGRRVKDPRWQGDLRIAGVRLEDWLNVQNRFAEPKPGQPAAQAARSYVTGRLGGHLKFSGRGDSIAEMVSTLDGTVSAWVNGGSISHLAVEAAGIDIAQSLGVLMRGDQALPMQCAATQFTARDGALNMDVGILDTTDTTLLLQGQVSLAQERLNLTARAFPKDFSFASLRSPVHLQGPLVAPKLKLETGPMVAKAGLAVALGTAVNPLAALIPLIDPGKKAPIGCEQALAQLRAVPTRQPPTMNAAGTEKAKGGGRPGLFKRLPAASAPATVGEQPLVPVR